MGMSAAALKAVLERSGQVRGGFQLRKGLDVREDRAEALDVHDLMPLKSYLKMPFKMLWEACPKMRRPPRPLKRAAASKGLCFNVIHLYNIM